MKKMGLSTDCAEPPLLSVGTDVSAEGPFGYGDVVDVTCRSDRFSSKDTEEFGFVENSFH